MATERDIDRKFVIQATSRAKGTLYTHCDGVFFKAADPALPAALRAYRKECARLGADPRQLQGIDQLLDRVCSFQCTHATQVAGVEPGNETRRLLRLEGGRYRLSNSRTPPGHVDFDASSWAEVLARAIDPGENAFGNTRAPLIVHLSRYDQGTRRWVRLGSLCRVPQTGRYVFDDPAPGLDPKTGVFEPAEPHVRFEYDPDFAGGDYHDVGRFAYVPLAQVETLGPEDAFTQATGLAPSCLVHYTLDDLYDAQGNRLDR